MVDEQIAKAWGRLGHTLHHSLGYYMATENEIQAIPDPATRPWAWATALRLHQVVVRLDYSERADRNGDEAWRAEVGTTWASRDTPEAALKAAIRAWAGTT